VKSLRTLPALALGSLAALLVSGCASEDPVSGAKIDYRSQAGRTPTIVVPPDLTQLTADPRAQAGTVVSATALQSALTGGDGSVAARSVSGIRIERSGQQRWLVSPASPEQVWPLLRSFWKEQGFTVALDQPNLGVMQTDWAENRVKLPQDFIRRTTTKLVDGSYDTGERDSYRTRLERIDGGTEISISHRGVSINTVDRSVVARSADPQLEAEMLSRLMLRLVNLDTVVRPGDAAASQALALVNASKVVPARARILEGRPAASIQIDDPFDRSWRRLGQALDRSGFTVEDRDRSQGTYFVRYIDPKLAGKEEGLLQRLFNKGPKGEELAGQRYRIQLKPEGSSTSGTCIAAILDPKGDPQNTDNARNIVKLLVAELR
jgi:outer membrane protein assembly factor BamC